MATDRNNPFSYKTAKEATGFLLWKTHNYWQREIKKCLKSFDLTHTQFVILANAQWLILHQDIVTQIDIAKYAQVDIMMTSNVLRTLEKKGFVLRKNHKIDTRAKVINLSESGLSVLIEAVKAVEKFDKQFFGQLEDEKGFNASLLELLG